MKFKQSLAVIFVCGLFAQMPLSSAAETAAAPAKAVSADLDDTLWGVAERANTVDDYQVYLDSFPQGKYVPFAKSRIKRLQAAVQAPVSQPVLTASGKVLVEPVMVSIPGKDFEIGKYEVTQKEWRDIMGDNPSNFKACGDNCPVEQVSWTDAKKFIAKLNQRTEKEYRLPTEDEWLDACADSCGGNETAWHATNSGGATHLVGQKQPNSFGLYDMSGNVAEWVADEWGSSNESAVGVVIVGSLGKRALLGGDYDTKPGETRGIDRRGLVQATRDRHIGFRLARTLK
jgi:formylglycine-generating enzyme required for sulfatase activity